MSFPEELWHRASNFYKALRNYSQRDMFPLQDVFEKIPVPVLVVA